MELALELERCRRAEAQLFAQAENQAIDPLLTEDLQNEAKHARIQKYARQNENSMLKMMHELGRLQTEFQYRHEIHELTPKERADPAKYELAPQSRSDVCSIRQSMAAAQQTDLRTSKSEPIATKLPCRCCKT